MTFKEFQTYCTQQQINYLKSETLKMQKAYRLWLKYADDMKALSLHPLDAGEIDDRRRELSLLSACPEANFGDTAVMRFSYERYLQENAA